MRADPRLGVPACGLSCQSISLPPPANIHPQVPRSPSWQGLRVSGSCRRRAGFGPGPGDTSPQIPVWTSTSHPGSALPKVVPQEPGGDQRVGGTGRRVRDSSVAREPLEGVWREDRGSAVWPDAEREDETRTDRVTTADSEPVYPRASSPSRVWSDPRLDPEQQVPLITSPGG